MRVGNQNVEGCPCPLYFTPYHLLFMFEAPPHCRRAAARMNALEKQKIIEKKNKKTENNQFKKSQKPDALRLSLPYGLTTHHHFWYPKNAAIAVGRQHERLGSKTRK